MPSDLLIEQINTFAKALDKCKEEDDIDRIKDILVAIQKLDLNMEILKVTQISRIVGKLRKHSDVIIARYANDLVSSWKTLTKTDERKNEDPPSPNFPLDNPTILGGTYNLIPLRTYLEQNSVQNLGPLPNSLYKYDINVRCDPKRFQNLSAGSSTHTNGNVVYWMSRDQRILDNWALLRAQQLALSKSVALAIVFTLAPTYLNGCIRQRGFMMRNLKIIEQDAMSLNIPFVLLLGHPKDVFPEFCSQNNIGTIVCDFSPLRIAREWKMSVVDAIGDRVKIEVVDAHNIAPCWEVSNKCEFAAKTIRSKIHVAMETFLKDFPPVVAHPHAWSEPPRGGLTGDDRWLQALDFTDMDYSVPEVTWCEPGERAAYQALKSFFQRLRNYSDDRNNPVLRKGVSNLSPYIRFGHISVQRIILEIKHALGVTNKSLFTDNRTTGAHSFCEEVVVRRELSDNFCYYNDRYDQIEGAHSWAQTTLREHWTDKRSYVYSQAQLENAETADDLWNAAQIEMVERGKMHGFMRMYWAKKILEWTPNPEEALRIAIYLNDKYSLDGRDPNGYVGCMWAIAGVHDRAWGPERPVFGKIRFMNYEGCKRKFDIKAYVAMNKRSSRAVTSTGSMPGKITSHLKPVTTSKATKPR